jgi:hypothetical protein
MYLIRTALLWVVLLCLGILAGCDSDDDDVLDAGNSIAILQDTSGGDQATGTFTIPAGAIVTSDSVDSQGRISFTVGAVPDNILSMFEGTLLGSAAYMPLDCVFSRFIVLGIPAGDATGAVNIYRYEASAVSQSASWNRVGTVNVRNGVAGYEAVNFGYYLAGREVTTTPEIEPPEVPTNLQASDGEFTDRIRLTWDPVFGATTYDIYRDSMDAPVGSAIGLSTWDDNSVADLDEHTYWVRAANTAGTSDFSEPDTGFVGEHDQGGGGETS